MKRIEMAAGYSYDADHISEFASIDIWSGKEFRLLWTLKIKMREAYCLRQLYRDVMWRYDVRQ